MDFSKNNTSFTPFFLESRTLPNYPPSQYPYSYLMNQLQYNMYYLCQQNKFLQQQFRQQNYANFIGGHQSTTEHHQRIKMEEPHKEDSQSFSVNSNEKTDKCIQQTEAISKDIFKKKNKIKKAKPQKNETKNIPKNYGKAIVSFIENNKELVKRVLSKFSSMTYISFMNILRARKNKINSIADLRSFWLESDDDEFPKIARILSNVFLRHFSLEYIFNSRISNFSGHVKYRARLIEALRDPEHFTSIKQY